MGLTNIRIICVISAVRCGCDKKDFPFRGGSDEIIQAPLGSASAEAHFIRVWEALFVHARPSASPPANSVRPLAVSGRVWYTNAVSRPHKGLLFFVLWCPNGAQLYKTMLLQDRPSYSRDLRKCPFHAGLRRLPMKRFSAL